MNSTPYISRAAARAAVVANVGRSGSVALNLEFFAVAAPAMGLHGVSLYSEAMSLIKDRSFRSTMRRLRGIADALIAGDCGPVLTGSLTLSTSRALAAAVDSMMAGILSIESLEQPTRAAMDSIRGAKPPRKRRKGYGSRIVSRGRFFEHLAPLLHALGRPARGPSFIAKLAIAEGIDPEPGTREEFVSACKEWHEIIGGNGRPTWTTPTASSISSTRSIGRRRGSSDKSRSS